MKATSEMKALTLYDSHSLAKLQLGAARMLYIRSIAQRLQLGCPQADIHGQQIPQLLNKP